MGKIEEYTDKIKNARYARDVRSAIVGGIKQCYQDSNGGFFKGKVENLSDLPTTNNVVNDTYYVVEKLRKYSWNGTTWEPSSFDESDVQNEIKTLEETVGSISNYLSLTNLIDFTEWFSKGTVDLLTVEYVSKTNVSLYEKEGDHYYIGIFTLKGLQPNTNYFLNFDITVLGDATIELFNSNGTAPTTKVATIENNKIIKFKTPSNSSCMAFKFTMPNQSAIIVANAVVAKYSENKTEVEDIRVDINGNIHKTAGDAVRGQIGELKEEYLDNQYNYKKIKLFENGYLPNSIKSLVKSLKIKGSFPVTVSAYTNLYGGEMNTVYSIPVQKSGTYFTVFTSDGTNFPDSRIRFLDVYSNELDYFSLTGSNSKTVKPTTSSDIYGIMIQTNYPTDQKIQIVIGEHKYEYQDYENIQSVTLNSVSDTSVLSIFNNGTYICLSENNSCEIEYAYDVSSDIAIIDDEITNICSTNSVVKKSLKDVFKNIQISETEESSIKLYLYTNLFNCNSGELITYFPKDLITSGCKISISTEDCSPFEYSKISFLDTQGNEMDYYTLTGYGYKREGLTLNLSNWLWAIKLTAPTQTTQKIQVSFGEKALEYVDYIFPQVCTVKVGENIGWESLKIKSDRMYLYTPSQCVISADYYTNKYVIDKDERLKYVSCGDSFTAGDFVGATDTRDIYDYESGYYKTYPWWIARRNNMNLLNMAHCGDTMRDFMAIYKNIPLDADYVTIAYGLNDYSNNIPIGTLSDTQADNTFLGCWNTALSWILENLPFAHVGVIIMPAYMGNEYRIATENVCKKYGIPCLNLYSDNRVPMFMNKDGADETVASSRYKKMVVSSSNGHPNVKAHKFISTSIEGWLKSI